MAILKFKNAKRIWSVCFIEDGHITERIQSDKERIFEHYEALCERARESDEVCKVVLIDQAGDVCESFTPKINEAAA